MIAEVPAPVGREHLVGVAAALGSGASWALGSILFKRLGESVESTAMTLVKGAMSVVLLGAAVGIVGFGAMAWDTLLLLAVSGLVGIAMADTLFFAALHRLSPHALAVLMMLGQVLTALLAVWLLGERPGSSAWAGVACILAGVAWVVWANLDATPTEVQTTTLQGILAGGFSMLCMSVSYLMAKRALDQVSALDATFVRMAAGTGAVLLLGIAGGRLRGWLEPFRERRLVWGFLGAVAVVTFGGFWLSLVAMKHLDLAIANTLNATEPLFILPLAALLLKEKPKAHALWGTVLALAGVFLICRP